MSHWTYVTGIIEVYIFGNTEAQNRYILDSVLDHLPIVSGSERDMSIYTIRKADHNSSSSVNEFGERLPKFKFNNQDTKWFLNQNSYLIVLDGSLRDRYFNETLKAVNKFLCRLAKRIWIQDVFVRVNSYEKEYIINDTVTYSEMLEDIGWAKFLCWQQYTDVDGEEDYPQFLIDKYNKEHQKNERGKKSCQLDQ